MSRKTIIEIVAYLFIFLFVYAAVSKLIEVDKFRLQVAQSPLLAPIAGVVAWLVPTIELGVSILLVIPRLRLTGLLGAFGLMVLFTIYIAAILSFSDDIPCSCGGVLQKLGWTEHLIFNIGFITLSATAIFLETSREKLTDKSHSTTIV